MMDVDTESDAVGDANKVDATDLSRQTPEPSGASVPQQEQHEAQIKDGKVKGNSQPGVGFGHCCSSQPGEVHSRCEYARGDVMVLSPCTRETVEQHADRAGSTCCEGAREHNLRCGRRGRCCGTCAEHDEVVRYCSEGGAMVILCLCGRPKTAGDGA
ncbi:hypothetical protein HD806DRAFT_444799 [Xylariaceae sp. AK1471]|nr:hypothetical protein HD806DRAFT_444799 [Xylariaceae sp. AK1471]